MIAAYRLKKQYGERVLFENESFTLGAGERVGLVGRNGHGKTTLFRLILGEEACDDGEIIIPKDYRLGYLNQHILLEKDTVLAEACVSLPEDEKDDQWKVKKILSGLGFTDKDWHRSPKEFSSGYQMRISLAKFLVSNPQLLLLDEPTNFLDIISIRWLTQFLRSWEGELLLISHDRSFMDQIITHTMGIHRGRIRKMPGTTQQYYTQIAKEEEIHERQRVNDVKVRKKEEEFINRFRAKARRASQAQSRLKRLEAMTVLEKWEALNGLDFAFNYEPVPAKVLIEAENLGFSYSGQKPLLINNVSISIQHGDRVGIIGQNGAGKTTLMKLLLEKFRPLVGTVRKHPLVKAAAFDHADVNELHPDLTIEKEILACLSIEDRGRARAICGAMMFPQDDALKKIEVLSGGEKCRVLLGRILAKSANVLMLDEPTHHLDMESCEAMIEAVNDFEGAVILVTHDEYFLRRVATKLIVFQGGGAQVFLGNYDEFLDRVGWQNEAAEKANAADEVKTPKVTNKKELRKMRAAQNEQERKVFQPLEQKIVQLEKMIVEQERQHQLWMQDLVAASERGDAVEIARLGQAVAQLKPLTEKAYEELICVQAEYEAKKAETRS